MKRSDGRAADEMRPVSFECDLLQGPAGSVSIRCGNTWVLCSATVEARIPPWLVGKGQGWVTAEYAMLPAATHSRGRREGWSGKWPKGRTLEIGRLIGRALRAATHLDRLGERSIVVDCDVLQADGGTRTASVTGAFVALAIALDHLRRNDGMASGVLCDTVSATSVGILDEGQIVLDMPYEEDHRAAVDLNIVTAGSGKLVEVQCTAESLPFEAEKLATMVALGQAGNRQLMEAQRAVLQQQGVDLDLLIRREDQ
jgi:ribonuclease PH